MSKKAVSKELRSVILSIEKWKKVLELEHWKFQIKRIDGDHPSEKEIGAECIPLVPYQMADILFYPRFFKESKEDQDEIVAHELVHCLTQEYKDLFSRALKLEYISVAEEQKINEKLTSWITRLIL